MKARYSLVFLATTAALAQLPPLAGTQRLIFENELVRISELRMSPGDHEPEHQHGPGVTIALGAYDNEVLALPARTTSKRHTELGEARWAEPSRHETRNTGNSLQRVIRVELKQEPAGGDAGPFDSVVTSKETQKLLFENAYARIIEERVPAGVAQPKHSHRKGVLVPLADGDVEVVAFDAAGNPSPVVRRQLHFGEAAWGEATLHTVKNAGKTEALNIRVEIK